MKSMMKNKQGVLLGFIPYDFRKPTWARLKHHMWNPEEERIWVPRTYGVGWTLNLFRLRQRFPWLFYLFVAAVAAGMARETWRFFTAEDEDD